MKRFERLVKSHIMMYYALQLVLMHARKQKRNAISNNNTTDNFHSRAHIQNYQSSTAAHSTRSQTRWKIDLFVRGSGREIMQSLITETFHKSTSASLVCS